MAPKCVPASEYSTYSVGWICALPADVVAARVMLDEDHGRPSDAGGDDIDPNNYFLGSIGGHNIVIACLPAGCAGSSSAATVAMHMQRTFTRLRIGLLVGVGSGAPSDEADIRLGDVVVSAPTNDTGGVIQFERTAAAVVICDGRRRRRTTDTFTRTRCLNKPPAALLTALARLQAEHKLDGSRIGEILANAVQRRPRLRSNFAPPAGHPDQLFAAQYVHAAAAADGSTTSDGSCRNCDANMLVRRPCRLVDGPEVHYGVIASSDMELCCGIARDSAREELGVSCFEKEAAGLMDNYPCLIIRGIGDYADSHKNLRWQSYAAGTAAAVAKELLEIMTPRDMEKAYSITTLLSSVHETLDNVKHTVGYLAKADDMGREESRHREILTWLSPIDPDEQQAEIESRRQEGTGRWFLESEEFAAWIDGQARTLYCRGIPGAGKTFITAAVVEYLRSSSSISEAGVAVVYCDYRMQEEQKAKSLLAALLRQVIMPEHARLPQVRTLVDLCKKQRRKPSLKELSDLLHVVAALYSVVYMVVDAMDECKATELPSFLFELRLLQAKLPAVRLMATARPQVDLYGNLIGALHLDIFAHQDDLERFIHGQNKRLSRHVQRDATLMEEVVRGITAAADGMFLLAKLHLDSLEGKMTIREIKAAIRSLPKGLCQLNDAYNGTITRIEQQDPARVELAKTVFCWVAHARRPLYASELQEALAIKIFDEELDEENKVIIDEVVALCEGLVTVDGKGGIVRFIHYTTDQFFRVIRADWISKGPVLLASSCLTYLAFSTFASGLCSTMESLRARAKREKLFRYATHHWNHHVHGVQAEVIELAVRLLQNQAHVRAISQGKLFWDAPHQSYDGGYHFYSPYIFGDINGMTLAAIFGLETVCAALQENGTQNDLGTTPLPSSSRLSRYLVGKLLLARDDADAFIIDDRGQTPLFRAAKRGHETAVRVLLPQSMNIISQADTLGRTPLSIAAAHGHERVVKLLLERGNSAVKPGIQWLIEPLFRAIEAEHVGIVELLLACDNMNTNSANEDGMTPLYAAARHGNEVMTQLLLARDDVDADQADRMGTTPLHIATKREHKAVVKLLLDRGVNATLADTEGKTALYIAAEMGRETVVKLLLGRGNAANVTDRKGKTPLYVAAEMGHRAVVQMLLERDDIDANLTNEARKSPLYVAAEMGHKAVVQLLLKRDDIDANLTNEACKSPLYVAAEVGHDAIVKLLLGCKRVNTNTTVRDGKSPLHVAAENGHEATVKQLLGSGIVDINCVTIIGETPLHKAASMGRVRIMELLLARKGNDTNLPDTRGMTPLYMAAGKGWVAVVELLLGCDSVDHNAADKDGNTPLHVAVNNKHKAVVKMLLAHDNVDLNLTNKYGYTVGPVMVNITRGRLLYVG